MSMKSNNVLIWIFLFLFSFSACSQQEEIVVKEKPTIPKTEKQKSKPHQYGGWYCPDNLFGFPPVDIAEWDEIKVVEGRLPTKEETQQGASLIFVDKEAYPSAKVLDLNLPRLATYYSQHSKREELVIIIQGVQIDSDSIVGFRFLNGGNGSAYFDEVSFLDEVQIGRIPDSKFVSFNLAIKADQERVWQAVSNGYEPVSSDEKLDIGYEYARVENLVATHAGLLYGSNYIQNDFEDGGYSEKFLIHQEENGVTQLVVSCGPFGQKDFEQERKKLWVWANRVKMLSEVF